MADNPTSPAAGSHESGGEQSPRSGVREQDRYLPIANISRIMKKALPANGKIAKDAKDTVQECVSEFISFVTSEDSVIRCRTVIGGFGGWGIDCFMKCNGILEMLLLASDKCQKEKRKTINGDDLLWAMATLGFEDYIEPLKVYLARYREGDAKGSVRGGDGSSKRDAVGGLPGQNAQEITRIFTHNHFDNRSRLMKVPPPRLRGLSAGTAYDPSFHARQRVGFGFAFVNSVNCKL
ncbi:hypothetical protein POTOM_029292 [Populus tomentosa]|uniref:Transcription factor CBF/NF-Y/archaeal histone domain-containing protein n=1 Tax=Populus tomentosa TaxID=118781 RepID=A0A8X7ZL05_POPTO|nr:hypothetical protein POTOM_029292 [Populus tomentosa]